MDRKSSQVQSVKTQVHKQDKMQEDKQTKHLAYFIMLILRELKDILPSKLIRIGLIEKQKHDQRHDMQY